jgi:hypothetical protein
VAQSWEESAKLFRLAAEQGNPEAQYQMAVCYMQGTGVTQSPGDGVALYKIAAEQGRVECILFLRVSLPMDCAPIRGGETTRRVRAAAERRRGE